MVEDRGVGRVRVVAVAAGRSLQLERGEENGRSVL